MLEELKIKNFKVLESINLELQKLTLFTGENSSGKSTAILAYLMAHWGNLSQDIQDYIHQHSINSLSINARLDDNIVIEILEKTKSTFSNEKGILNIIEYKKYNDKIQNIIFLCADRVGPQSVYPIRVSDGVGIKGEFAPSYFAQNMRKPIKKELCHPELSDEIHNSLQKQANYWFSHILGVELETEITADVLTVNYIKDDISFSAINTGFGTSLILPIIIACLSAQEGKDNIVIIENPEIHLHPKAQARLADFLAFVANAGVRVIIETHCEHLIYKLCCNVKNNIINNDDVVIHYKEINKDFDIIKLDKNGRFIDNDGEHIAFPAGFFDAILQEYLDIYR